MTKTIDPKDISTGEFHALMLGAIAPRPIAFASTIDKEGNVNLSPFSFFNAFGSNPPLLIFSPARRVRDNTIKHTLENVLEVPEVVINIVNFPMVEQMSLASTEYEKGVNEFIKAGFTEIKSDKIRPPRVAESPVAFECIVKQIIETGTQGGAGNLVICEIVMAHFNENILDENGKINTPKMDLVARMGGDYYCRVIPEALFEIPKPLVSKGIGFDNLPSHVKESHILSANNLGRLANVEQLPTAEEVQNFKESTDFYQIFHDRFVMNKENLHQKAKELLNENDIKTAWLTLCLV